MAEQPFYPKTVGCSAAKIRYPSLCVTGMGIFLRKEMSYEKHCITKVKQK